MPEKTPEKPVKMSAKGGSMGTKKGGSIFFSSSPPNYFNILNQKVNKNQ